MATDDYISPYTADERTRRSVMAALVENKSIHDVYERDARRTKPGKYPSFKPEFDGDSFSGALHIVTGVIEALCFEGAEGWDGVQRLVPQRQRLSARLLGGPSVAPVRFGSDRATLSLYDPLENLADMLSTFLRGVHSWATKSKYFKESALPFIAHTLNNSISEASTANKLRELLIYVGPIDRAYVRSFDDLAAAMEGPILELRALGEFTASILQEGDEIPAPGNGHNGMPGTPRLSKSSLSTPSSHSANVRNLIAEASGPGESKSQSPLPTASPYFNPLREQEPATLASTGGNPETEMETGQRGGGNDGFDDLLEAAARYNSSSTQKSTSPQPQREQERESMVNTEDPGSPKYSPPPSPSFSVDTLVKPFSVSSLKAEGLPRDIPTSILDQRSSLYHIEPSPAPPGTPHWKIELSERKGHPVRTLHVSPRELAILAKCLTLVNTATLKGEECMRVIIQEQNLATDMEEEFDQWEDLCNDLEDNVSIDEKEEKQKRKEELASASASAKADTDQDAKANDAHDAKDPSSSPVSGTDAYGRGDWFGTAGGGRESRDDARRAPPPPPPPPKDPKGPWASRKVAPSSDPDETEDEEEEDRGQPRDFGMGSPSSAGRDVLMGGSPMSARSRRSSGTDGMPEATPFEEEFEEGDEGDREMLDVGEGAGGLEEGEIAEEPAVEVEEGKRSGNANGDGGGKKALKSGGRVVGLYGELL